DSPKTLSDYFKNSENIVLVVDIGGGTSDFSLVKVKIPEDPKENPEMERLAVSDHILLGGDNLDLALAAHVEQQLTGQQRKLSPRLWEALTAQCRRAKEILWTTEQDQFPITIAEQGSRLIGKTKNYILSQNEFEQIILDGFFPELDWDADLPAKKIQGLRTLGLPYASDTAITRHLLRFLRNHCSQIEPERFPTHVLFNGGTLEPSLLQEKIRRLLEKWGSQLGETEKSVQVLPQEQMQLAVAKGATYYHLVREGKGLQIKGGSARSYYVSLLVDGMEPGSQNLAWLCILPQQASVEEYQEVQGHTLEIAINQPVQFEMRASSIRTQDHLGDIIQIEQEELERDFTELPPIQTFLGIDRNRLPKKATTLGIQLRAKLNEIGTLSLECVNHHLSEEWRLEFRIRESAPEVIQSDQSITVDNQWEPPSNWDDVQRTLQSWFGKRSRQENLPLSLNKQLEALLGPRSGWPLPLLREIADQLLSGMGTRVRSVNHEMNWLKICGFCLRPGFGFPNDELRIKQLTEWIARGPQFRKERNVEVEWWIFCRRVAAGLPSQTQEAIFKSLEERLVEGNRKPRSSKLPKGKRPASISPSALNELWLLLSNLESVPHEKKRTYSKQLLDRLEKGQSTGIEALCLARFGSRELVHAGSLYVIPPKEVESWIQSLLEIHHQKPIQELPLVLTKLGQFTGDRHRDISPDLRKELIAFVESYDEDGSLVRLLTEEAKRDTVEILESNLQNWLFGDELPIGLKLAKSS
ncbi:MAG: Hsp70 family protein, partial [bacterium]